MTSHSKVLNWETPINARVARVYTPISSAKDSDAEKILKKKCLRCDKLKSHKEYTIGYDRDPSTKTLKGIYRNNNCKPCSKKNHSQNATVSSLNTELQEIKELYQTKETELEDLKETFETNMELLNTIMENIASHTNLKVHGDGSVTVKSTPLSERK